MTTTRHQQRDRRPATARRSCYFCSCCCCCCCCCYRSRPLALALYRSHAAHSVLDCADCGGGAVSCRRGDSWRNHPPPPQQPLLLRPATMMTTEAGLVVVGGGVVGGGGDELLEILASQSCGGRHGTTSARYCCHGCRPRSSLLLPPEPRWRPQRQLSPRRRGGPRGSWRAFPKCQRSPATRPPRGDPPPPGGCLRHDHRLRRAAMMHRRRHRRHRRHRRRRLYYPASLRPRRSLAGRCLRLKWSAAGRPGMLPPCWH